MDDKNAKMHNNGMILNIQVNTNDDDDDDVEMDG